MLKFLADNQKVIAFCIYHHYSHTQYIIAERSFSFCQFIYKIIIIINKLLFITNFLMSFIDSIEKNLKELKKRVTLPSVNIESVPIPRPRRVIFENSMHIPAKKTQRLMPFQILLIFLNLKKKTIQLEISYLKILELSIKLTKKFVINNNLLIILIL